MPELILLNKIEKTPFVGDWLRRRAYAIRTQTAAQRCAFASAAAAADGLWNKFGRSLRTESANLITSLSSLASSWGCNTMAQNAKWALP